MTFSHPVPLPSIVIGSLVGVVGILFLALFSFVGLFSFSVPATVKAESNTEGTNNARR